MDDLAGSNCPRRYDDSLIKSLTLVLPLEIYSLTNKLGTGELLSLETVTDNKTQEPTSVQVEIEKTKTHIHCHMQAAVFGLIKLIDGKDWYCKLDLNDEENPAQSMATEQEELDGKFVPSQGSVDKPLHDDAAVKNEGLDEGEKTPCDPTKSSKLLVYLEMLADNQIKAERSNDVRDPPEVENVTAHDDDANEILEDPEVFQDTSDPSEEDWKHTRKTRRRSSRWRSLPAKGRKITKRQSRADVDKPSITDKSRNQLRDKVRPRPTQGKELREQQPRRLKSRFDEFKPLSRFQCMECVLIREDLDDLVNHFKTNHKLAKNYLMKLVKIDENDYEQAEDKVSSEPVISCPYCFCKRTKDTMLKHLSNCHDMLPDYEQCTRRVMDPMANDAAQVLSLPLLQRQLCSECDSTFSDGRTMYNHFSTLHREVKDYETKMTKVDDAIDINLAKYPDLPASECKFCKKNRQGSSIFRHIYWCHSTDVTEVIRSITGTKSDSRKKTPRYRRGPNPLTVQIGRNTCKFCMRVFETYSKKSKHFATCTDNPNRRDMLSCRFCCHTTPYPERMEEHMKKHMEKYVCELCAEQFQYKSTFYLHKRKAHGIGKPIESHKCSSCNKEFSTKSSYKRHLHTHEDQDAYTCETCGKGFKFKRNLVLHRNTVHLGIFPYHCDKCGYGLPKLTKLRSHRCERIRNRNRDVGNAAELRARYQEGEVMKPRTDVVLLKKVTGWRKRRIPGALEKRDSTLYYPHNMEEFHRELAEKESAKKVDVSPPEDSAIATTVHPTNDVAGTSNANAQNTHKTARTKTDRITAGRHEMTSTNIPVNTQEYDPACDLVHGVKQLDQRYSSPGYCMDYPGPTSSLLQVEHLAMAQHQHGGTGWPVAPSNNMPGHTGHQVMGHMPINHNMQTFLNMDQMRMSRPNQSMNHVPYGFNQPQ